jgi:hypothetical protein
VAVGATDGCGLGLGENPDRREAFYSILKKRVLGRPAWTVWVVSLGT